MSCTPDAICKCTGAKYLGDGSYSSGFRGIPPWQTQYARQGSIHWPKGATYTRETAPCTPEQPGASSKERIGKHSQAVTGPVDLMKGIAVTPAPDPSVATLPENQPPLPSGRPPYIM